MRRLVATCGAQTITGLTDDKNADTANTLEVYLDSAYGSIRIDTAEWDVTFDDEWRTVPEFPNYEMSRYGVIRNKRFKRVMVKRLVGGIFVVNLRDGSSKASKSRSVAKLYREIWPEHIKQVEVDEGPGCDWKATAKRHIGTFVEHEDVYCAMAGKHRVHVFRARVGFHLHEALTPNNDIFAICKSQTYNWAVAE